MPSKYHNIVYNKKNNQMMITLSRRKLRLTKNQKPKRIKLDFKGFDW